MDNYERKVGEMAISRQTFDTGKIVEGQRIVITVNTRNITRWRLVLMRWIVWLAGKVGPCEGCELEEEDDATSSK